MLALGSSDPTRAICSTLIAEAFEAVGFPILPVIASRRLLRWVAPIAYEKSSMSRHYRLFGPDATSTFRHTSRSLKPSAYRDYRSSMWVDVDQLEAPRYGPRLAKREAPTECTAPSGALSRERIARIRLTE